MNTNAPTQQIGQLGVKAMPVTPAAPAGTNDASPSVAALISALRGTGGTGAMGLGLGQGSPAYQGVQSSVLPGIMPGASVPYSSGMTGGGIF